MSHRCDFEITANLREDAPASVINMLTYLLTPGASMPDEPLEHDFFSGESLPAPFVDWIKDGEPIAGDAGCSFRRVHRYSKHGVDHSPYTIHLRYCSSLEDIYECAILFASWLAQWCEQDQFVGYVKSEYGPVPTLLYFHNEQLFLLDPKDPPESSVDGSLWE